MPFKRDDFALFNREGKAAMLQFKRLVAEEFTTPARQCRNLGAIINSNRFKIINSRDHLGGNAMAFAATTGPQDAVHAMRDAYDARRQRLLDGLAGTTRVTVARPTGAFYVFANVAAVRKIKLVMKGGAVQ